MRSAKAGLGSLFWLWRYHAHSFVMRIAALYNERLLVITVSFALLGSTEDARLLLELLYSLDPGLCAVGPVAGLDLAIEVIISLYEGSKISIGMLWLLVDAVLLGKVGLLDLRRWKVNRVDPTRVNNTTATVVWSRGEHHSAVGFLS